MRGDTTHSINRQIFDLYCSGEDQARRIRHQAIHYIAPAMEEVLAEMLAAMEVTGHYVIDRLEIDLGTLSESELGGQALLERFRTQCSARLGELVHEHDLISADDAARTYDDAGWEMTKIFWETGDLPWWADKQAMPEMDRILASQLKNDPEKIVRFLHQAFTAGPAKTIWLSRLLQRIQWQYPAAISGEIDRLMPWQEWISGEPGAVLGLANAMQRQLKKKISSYRRRVQGAMPAYDPKQDAAERIGAHSKEALRAARWLAGNLPFGRIRPHEDAGDRKILHLLQWREAALLSLEKRWRKAIRDSQILSRLILMLKRSLSGDKEACAALLSAAGETTTNHPDIDDRQRNLSAGPQQGSLPLPSSVAGSSQDASRSREQISTGQHSPDGELPIEGPGPAYGPPSPAMPSEESPIKRDKALREEKAGIVQPEERRENGLRPEPALREDIISQQDALSQQEPLTQEDKLSQQERLSQVDAPWQQEPLAQQDKPSQRERLAQVDAPSQREPLAQKDKLWQVENEQNEGQKGRLSRWKAEETGDAEYNRHDEEKGDGRRNEQGPRKDIAVSGGGEQETPAGNNHDGEETEAVQREGNIRPPGNLSGRDEERRRDAEERSGGEYAKNAESRVEEERESKAGYSSDEEERKELALLQKDVPQGKVPQEKEMQGQRDSASAADALPGSAGVPGRRQDGAGKKALSGTQRKEMMGLIAQLYRSAPPEAGRRDPGSRHEGATRRILVENAGLCLIVPYLGYLFRNLGYANEESFMDSRRMYKGIYVLQYLATGRTGAPEYLLPFNKLLCGLPTDEVIPAAVRLGKKELAEADRMLAAVIANWGALGNTSLNGLRGTFLCRNGILKDEGDHWVLQVERKEYDILLNGLSWGYSMIRMPWMEKHIVVEW